MLSCIRHNYCLPVPSRGGTTKRSSPCSYCLILVSTLEAKVFFLLLVNVTIAPAGGPHPSIKNNIYPPKNTYFQHLILSSTGDSTPVLLEEVLS